MNTNPATQRSPAATPVTPSPILAEMTSHPIRREIEYGCVDWFPYAAPREARTERLEHHDIGLAVGIA
jgi:hypothetical protein